ncbi:hypothetical protein ACPCHT_21255 [Nucisporomicrobium flavum]|nr:hypothetical protein [Nucisporomicrobium flavum]
MTKRRMIALGGSTLLPLTGLVLAVVGSVLTAAVESVAHHPVGAPARRH